MNELMANLTVVWQSIPLWLQAMALLLAGAALSMATRFILANLLRLVRFDRLTERVGLTEFLRKGGVKYTASRLVGVLGFWVVLLVTFVEVARLLDIGVITSVFAKFADVLPGMVAALLVGAVGWAVIVFIGNFAVTIARNAGFVHSRILGKLIRYVGIVLVVVIALEQIEIGGGVFGTILLITFGAIALGAALAFGIGCKDIARDSVQKGLRSLRENGRAGGKSDLEG